MLTSALTLIEQGRFFYRGQDAVALATRASLEDVAALLWDCDRASASAPADSPLDTPTRALLRRSAALPLPARLVGAWGLLAPLAHERSDLTRPQQAAGLLRRMALAGTLQQPARRPRAVTSTCSAPGACRPKRRRCCGRRWCCVPTTN